MSVPSSQTVQKQIIRMRYLTENRKKQTTESSANETGSLISFPTPPVDITEKQSFQKAFEEKSEVIFPRPNGEFSPVKEEHGRKQRGTFYSLYLIAKSCGQRMGEVKVGNKFSVLSRMTDCVRQEDRVSVRSGRRMGKGNTVKPVGAGKYRIQLSAQGFTCESQRQILLHENEFGKGKGVFVC